MRSSQHNSNATDVAARFIWKLSVLQAPDTIRLQTSPGIYTEFFAW